MTLSATYKQTTILAIRLRQLGDILATLGTLRALKDAEPDRRIAFLVDAHYHDMLRDVEFVDQLVPQPPKITGLDAIIGFQKYVEDLRGLGADYALDFHCNTRSALLTYLSGAPVRIGFDVRIRKLVYTEVEPRAIFANGRTLPRTSHESAMALGTRCTITDLQGSVLNTINVDPGRMNEGRRMALSVGVTAEAIDSGRVVGINPGKPYPAKEWPESNFVELVKHLTSGGRSVVVLWGPGEQEAAERLVAVGGRGVYLSPALRLDELGSFLRQLAVVITIDSGLKHLAVAVGVPTVTLFGPTDPGEWHMGGRHDRVLFAALPCSPCRLLECPLDSSVSPCMKELTPDAVMREILTIEKGIGVR